ncbi:MAG: hypothetical protein SGPRY_014722, partial [Prymnesium sp.]
VFKEGGIFEDVGIASTAVSRRTVDLICLTTSALQHSHETVYGGVTGENKIRSTVAVKLAAGAETRHLEAAVAKGGYG